jgi:hypothetical protein
VQHGALISATSDTKDDVRSRAAAAGVDNDSHTAASVEDDGHAAADV